MNRPTVRKPGAFPVSDPPPEPPQKPARTKAGAAKTKTASRRPVATSAELDHFEATNANLPAPPPSRPAAKRRWNLAGIFAAAIGILVSLSLGLWVDQLVRDLFSRADWMGWLAIAVAGVAAISLLMLVGREMLALRRLQSTARLQQRGAEAIERNDSKSARKVVGELTALLSEMPVTARGRAQMENLKGEIIDGADLIGIAETELLAPLDRRARTAVLDAAKRVSLVTAVSPRAVVDVAFVIFEAARLIRRISELYGGRPGTIGFFRLARSVVSHLAVTGSIAVGDSLAQQIIGHGLAARLSARLGEGVVNGLMTARIGIAAIETARPLPFHRLKRPGMSDFLSELTNFWAKKEADGDKDQN